MTVSRFLIPSPSDPDSLDFIPEKKDRDSFLSFLSQPNVTFRRVYVGAYGILRVGVLGAFGREGRRCAVTAPVLTQAEKSVDRVITFCKALPGLAMVIGWMD